MKKFMFFSTFYLFSLQVIAQTCNDFMVASTPTAQFSVNGNEVTDNKTGLVWQRCVLGKSGPACDIGTTERGNWQWALQSASAPWRLPNIKELRSIVEDKCISPAINLAVFPSLPAAGVEHWSSTQSNVSSGDLFVLAVEFTSGEMKSLIHTDLGVGVRLVRDVD